MTTTHVEQEPCPKGCGALIAPRGRGAHYKICPNNQEARKAADPLRGRIEREIAEAQSTIDAHLLKAEAAFGSEDDSDPAALLNSIGASLQDAITAMTRRDHYAKLLKSESE